MYARLKRTSGKLELLYSDDGRTWTVLDGDFDLVFNVPPAEIQAELVEGTVLRYLSSQEEKGPE